MVHFWYFLQCVLRAKTMQIVKTMLVDCGKYGNFVEICRKSWKNVKKFKIGGKHAECNQAGDDRANSGS